MEWILKDPLINGWTYIAHSNFTNSLWGYMFVYDPKYITQAYSIQTSTTDFDYLISIAPQNLTSVEVVLLEAKFFKLTKYLYKASTPTTPTSVACCQLMDIIEFNPRWLSDTFDSWGIEKHPAIHCLEIMIYTHSFSWAGVNPLCMWIPISHMSGLYVAVLHTITH